MISEAEYIERAQKELKAVLAALDMLDPDAIEAELESDILTIEFTDGRKYILNSHRAARQLWLAADLAAYHFSFQDGAWIADKSGEELWATLERLIQARLSGARLRRP